MQSWSLGSHRREVTKQQVSNEETNKLQNKPSEPQGGRWNQKSRFSLAAVVCTFPVFGPQRASHWITHLHTCLEKVVVSGHQMCPWGPPTTSLCCSIVQWHECWTSDSKRKRTKFWETTLPPSAVSLRIVGHEPWCEMTKISKQNLQRVFDSLDLCGIAAKGRNEKRQKGQDGRALPGRRCEEIAEEQIHRFSRGFKWVPNRRELRVVRRVTQTFAGHSPAPALWKILNVTRWWPSENVCMPLTLRGGIDLKTFRMSFTLMVLQMSRSVTWERCFKTHDRKSPQWPKFSPVEAGGGEGGDQWAFGDASVFNEEHSSCCSSASDLQGFCAHPPD